MFVSLQKIRTSRHVLSTLSAWPFVCGNNVLRSEYAGLVYERGGGHRNLAFPLAVFYCEPKLGRVSITKTHK